MYNSQTGHFGVRVQDIKGTFKIPQFFFKLTSGGLGSDSELIIPDPEIGGNRDLQAAYPGSVRYSGDYNFYFRPEDLAVLVYAALGGVTVSGYGGACAGVYRHKITPENTLPWLSVEEKINDTMDVFHYTDVKVNTLRFEISGNGLLTGTASMIGITQSGCASPEVYVPETAPILTSHPSSVILDESLMYVRSASFEINNNLEDDDYRVGRRTLGDIGEHRRELSVSLTIRPDSIDVYRKAVNGAVNACMPGCDAYESDVTLNFETCDDLIKAGCAHKWAMQIVIPHAIWNPFTIEPSGDDTIEHELNLTPIQVGSEDIVTTYIWNNIPDLTA